MGFGRFFQRVNQGSTTMSLWDPEAAGNAAIFLRLDKMAMLEIQNAPFDGGNCVWVPSVETGYMKAMVKGDGDKPGTSKVLRADGKEKTLSDDKINKQNPPKYELLEDLANMTYLSEAAVGYNLSERYVRFLIYTYSGLFCVTVNPYKWLPVYDNHVVGCYKGKRKSEMPPHIYSVSDNAYNDMLRERHNQSMLITGESGAGKTVNTKRVIQYFAVVAALGATGKSGDDGAPALKGGGTLEDQIVAANPAMEAFGNAKTTRNDNSSRFGKFIRIHFGLTGKLASGDIDTYLLEKSRVVFQLKAERCFHIFYQICSGGRPDINELTMISTNPYDYKYSSLGEIKVKSIDDVEELTATDDSFDVLGFIKDEKDAVYRITAGIMHSGNMVFKQKPREEQAEADSIELIDKAGFMLGISGSEYAKALCSPRVKVGSEYVVKGQTVDQVSYALGAICKAMFEKLFNWLVTIVNRALSTDQPRSFFIGILDIAGFEIFEFNTFEQSCINFTNEKLQQFFNHHMFVLEQEEYVREGIEWEMVDFGMDLEATIQLMEKPMGLLAILEEETLFPKASDKSFDDKLKENLLGKSPVFLKKQPGSRDKTAHFAISHYAGIVNYNLTDWLTKNKDQCNDTVVDQLKKSTNLLVVYLFREHPGQPEEDPNKGKEKGKKGKDAKVYKTVSSAFRAQLDALLTTLNSTDPHFIRCIVPNNFKTPGLLDSALVMHQLTCNGVLEGIRICRRGFPNRTVYLDFKHRFIIIKPKEVYAAGTDLKAAAKVILESIEAVDDRWRLGHTKVFFRAGTVGMIEEVRDECIKAILNYIQALCRGYLSRKQYKIEQFKKNMIPVMQRNFKKYLFFRDWTWYFLLNATKRFIGQEDMEAVVAKLEEEAAIACSAYDKEVTERDRLNEEIQIMTQDKKDMMSQIELEQGDLSGHQQDLAKATTAKAEKEDELAAAQKKIG